MLRAFSCAACFVAAVVARAPARLAGRLSMEGNFVLLSKRMNFGTASIAMAGRDWPEARVQQQADRSFPAFCFFDHHALDPKVSAAPVGSRSRQRRAGAIRPTMSHWDARGWPRERQLRRAEFLRRKGRLGDFFVREERQPRPAQGEGERERERRRERRRKQGERRDWREKRRESTLSQESITSADKAQC